MNASRGMRRYNSGYAKFKSRQKQIARQAAAYCSGSSFMGGDRTPAATFANVQLGVMASRLEDMREAGHMAFTEPEMREYRNLVGVCLVARCADCGLQMLVDTNLLTRYAVPTTADSTDRGRRYRLYTQNDIDDDALTACRGDVAADVLFTCKRNGVSENAR